MKPLVIYHANCADGFGAAFAAWLKFGDYLGIDMGAEYVPVQYDDLFSIEDWHMRYAGSQREVYILDFSFPRPVMEHIFATVKRVVWLDHHKTTFEMWIDEYTKGDFVDSGEFGDGSGSRIILDDNKSGAMLAWEYFHPGTEVPMLIKHIDDYDRWQFKIEGTKAFNKALWSYAPWTFAQWCEMFWNAEHDEFYSVAATGLLRDGEALLRAHDQNVQSVVKGSARACSIQLPDSGKSFLDMVRLNGLAANCPHHLTSDVGHELAVRSGTFGLCWTLANEGLIAKCSLRSNGDYDVSSIAKALGGGGHRNAAGFEVPIETLLGWLK